MIIISLCSIVVDCGVPDAANNTETVSYNATYRGDVAQYVCMTGYTAVGNTTRVCQSNRKWSGDTPFCQSIYIYPIVNHTPHAVPPFLSSYTGGLIVITEVGGEVKMNCTANGVPTPRISWRKDKQLLINSSSFSIVARSGRAATSSSSIPGLLQTVSTLTVSDVRGFLSGLYKCRADSTAGSVTLTTPYNLSVVIPQTGTVENHYNLSFAVYRCFLL